MNIVRSLWLCALMFGGVIVTLGISQPCAFAVDPETITFFKNIKSLVQEAQYMDPPLTSFPRHVIEPYLNHINHLIYTLEHWNALFSKEPTFENFVIPLDKLIGHLMSAGKFLDAILASGYRTAFEKFDALQMYQDYYQYQSKILQDPRILKALTVVQKNLPPRSSDLLSRVNDDKIQVMDKLFKTLIEAAIPPPKALLEAQDDRQRLGVEITHPFTKEPVKLKSPALLNLLGQVSDPADGEAIWWAWQKQMGLVFTQSTHFLNGISQMRTQSKTLKKRLGLSDSVPNFENHAQMRTYLEGDPDPRPMLYARLKETETILQHAKTQFKAQYPHIPFSPWHYYYLMDQGSGILDPYFPFSRLSEIVYDVLARMGIDLRALEANGIIRYDYEDRPNKQANGFMISQVLGIRPENERSYPPTAIISGIVHSNQKTGSFAELVTKLHEIGHCLRYVATGIFPIRMLGPGLTQPRIDTHYFSLSRGSTSYEEIFSQFVDDIVGKLYFLLLYGKTESGETISESVAKEALEKFQISDVLFERFLIALSLTDFEIHAAPQPLANYQDINKIWWKNAKQAMGLEFVDTTVPEWISLKMHFAVENAPMYYAYRISKQQAREMIDALERRYGSLLDPRVGQDMMKLWQLGPRYSGKEVVMLVVGDLLKQIPCQ